MSKRIHPWTAFRSMQGKLLLLVCAITLLSALIMTWINQIQTYRVARGATIERLASEADLIAAGLSETIRNLRNDAQIIAQTPPIQGLVRTTASGGIDPHDGSSDAIWRARLASIFSSTMQTRPAYMQMRYIGLADGGRELVRVNHVNGENFIVDRHLLQQKGDEFYFQAAAALGPDRAYLSDVTLNREFGEVDPREIPTIRLLLPIETDTGEPFGFIAINADYEALLRQATATTALANSLVISNHNGDFLASGPNQTRVRFGYHADHTYQPHPLLGHATSAQGPVRSEYDGEIFATRQIEFSDIETPLDLRVMVLRDTASVNAAALQNLPVIVISSIILVLASLSVTILAINHVMRPFRTLSTRIENAESIHQIQDFPIERLDEVGTLARAFSDVTAGLVSSEARTRAIIEGIVEGVIVIDEMGHIETFNPACERMFGYRADALMGTNISLLIPSDSVEEHDGFLARRADGEPADVIGTVREVHGVRKNGSRFPMELSVSEIELPGGRLYCGVVRDISQRKEMERMKDEFISTVNHEIRTPLTSLVGSLGLLKIKAAGRLDRKGEKLPDLAHTSGERLTVLVNDILDLEKIAAGKLEYDMQPTEMTELVKDVVAQNSALEDRYGIRFELAIETTEATVLLDRNRFHQALGNLLSNAAKFSPVGATVGIRLVREPGRSDMVQVTVEDNGPGIPEDFRDKIFQRFSQADGSTTRSEGSSGLGLNITKTLIEAFDGEVKFDSVEGQGTRFHFHLPVHGSREEGHDAKTAGSHSLS